MTSRHLIVIGLTGLAVIGPTILWPNFGPARGVTKRNAEQIRQRVAAYYNRHGKLPFSAATTYSPDMALPPPDGWGNDFLCRFDTNTFTAISMGPDGEQGTWDDVVIGMELMGEGN